MNQHSTPLSPSGSSGPPTPGLPSRPPSASAPVFQPGPQKSRAIAIINPTTHAKVEFEKPPSKAASPAPGAAVVNPIIKMDRPSSAASVASAASSTAERTDEDKARIKKNAAEVVAAAAAKAEKEKAEREAKEKADREAKERAETEAAEAQRKSEEEAAAAEKAKSEEQERVEREKAEAELKAKAEAERLAKEQEEKAKAEAEKSAADAAAKKKAEEDAAKADTKTEAAKADSNADDKASPAPAVNGDAASMPPPPAPEKKAPRIKPGPLDLSKASVHSGGLPSAPLSALGSARIIDDINKVEYPKNVQSPRPELNANAEPGKFKYDRDFLLQFMQVCREKPDSLPSLDAIGMDDASKDPSRSPVMARRGGPPGGRGGSAFDMGAFKPPKTSEERFAASAGRGGLAGPGGIRGSMGPRSVSGSAMLPGKGGMVPPSPGGRSRSGRGGQRGPKGGHPHQQGGPTIPLDQVTPLENSENRWVPIAIVAKTKKVEVEPLEVIQRKVKALLNKLTVEKFEPISNQIIEWANKSVNETDGTSLRTVIQLTFMKATDEPNFSSMYAKLCRKMWDMIDPSISDEAIIGADGKPVSGNLLYRKYLLNRCQEDFERGWKTTLPKKTDLTEAELLSEEYYIAAKAKRRGLGLVKLIGELYKLDMLTERIMHECIKRLLANVTDPEEEEVESVCKLLSTIGDKLDHERSRGHIDVYFERLKMMQNNDKISSRIKYMIQDVVELRSDKWIPRRDAGTAKTLAEIHEDAQRQKEEAEMMKRTTSSGGRGMPRMHEQMGSRTNSRRGQNRDGPAPDGWSTVGGGAGATVQKAGSLSKFGSMRSKTSTQSLGPSPSVFAGLRGRDLSKDGSQTESPKEEGGHPMSRSSSQSNNPFALLNAQEPSTPPGTGERPKMKLLPRSKPVEEGDKGEVAEDAAEENGPVANGTMSDKEVERKIKNMLDELWTVKDVNETVLCFEEFPTTEIRARGIKSMIEAVMEKKQAGIDLVKDVFRKAREDKILEDEHYIKGFTVPVEMVDDMAIDVPTAYGFVGQLLAGGARLSLGTVMELAKPLAELPGLTPPQARMIAEYLKAVKTEAGDAGVEEQVREASLDFKTLFPEDERSDDNVNKVLDKYGLEMLKASA